MSLGMHTIPIHYQSWDYMRKIGPQLITTLQLDPEYLSNVFSRLGPSGRLVLRHYPEGGESEQWDAVKKDPAGYGRWHADWWNKKLLDIMEQQRRRNLPVIDLDRVTCLHVNEMPVWEPEFLPAILDTETAFLFSMASLGLSGGGLGINTGHPALLDDNGIPIWDPFLVLQPAFDSGNHYLAFHEYWPHTGPQGGWGYLAGRLIHCPLKVPYIVTECGVDEFTVDDSIPQSRRGWRAWMDAKTYVDQLYWYYIKILETGKVLGVCPFTWDGATWDSFDMLPAEGTILGRKWPVMQYVFDWGGNDTDDTNGGNGKDNDDGIDDNYDVYPTWMDAKGSAFCMNMAEATSRLSVAAGIEPRAFLALLMTETNIQNTPGPDPTIRVEAHILRRLIDDKKAWGRNFRILGPKDWEGHRVLDGDAWKPYHGDQTMERVAFTAAVELAGAEIALRSTSMGLGQVMGFNYRLLGYDSAEAMYKAFAGEPGRQKLGVYDQIVGVFSYLFTVEGMLDALRSKDWRKVARLYNGPGNVDSVAAKLAAAYDKLV